LAQVVELLPDNSLVGFITFGTYVQVKAHCFSLMLHIIDSCSVRCFIG